MKALQQLPQTSQVLVMITVACSFSLLSTTAMADWGVGIGIDNEAMYYHDKDSDIELTALFNLKYQGSKVNLDKDGLSYKVFQADKAAVELLATSKHRGFNADDNKTFTGMAERDDSLDLGGRLIVESGFAGTTVLDVTKDVQDSKGISATLKVGGIAPHATHWTGKRQASVAAVGGVRYQDAKVVDHYFGVKNTEVTADRAAYKGKAATTPFIGVEAQANLTEHITLDGGVNIIKKATIIQQSPLTDDKKYGVEAGVGITYWF